MVYTRYREDCIINKCPYVPLNDDDERCCYSTLLLHTIWPIEGEVNVLHGLETAVECLRQLKDNKVIPQYVENVVESINNSYVLRSNTGGMLVTLKIMKMTIVTHMRNIMTR